MTCFNDINPVERSPRSPGDADVYRRAATPDEPCRYSSCALSRDPVPTPAPTPTGGDRASVASNCHPHNHCLERCWQMGTHPYQRCLVACWQTEPESSQRQ